MTDAIAVEGLGKRFGQVEAVAGISFEVHKGELFGFLGPNGAGKTTTINMLTGLARPDAGSIRIAGVDRAGRPRGVQHLIGVVPDESNLYPELSGFDNLCFCGALYGMREEERRRRAGELLEQFGLGQAAKRKFGGYSRGMKRRLTIAAGIVHNPEILFLDEPTTGIDVASARQMRQSIADLNRAGTTVFLTTHYIEEAERLCHRVAFIVSGRIVQIDTVESLVQPIRGRHAVEIACATLPDGLGDAISGAFPGLEFRVPGSQGPIRVESAEPIRVGLLVRFLEDRGIEVSDARRMRLSLEDVFVQVTGVASDAMRREKERQQGGGQQ